MIRKNTRFRIYLLTLSLLYAGGMFFLLHRQSAAYERRLQKQAENYDKKLTEVVQKVSEGSSVVSVSDPVSPSLGQEEVYSGPSYFLMGSGHTGRWGYLDIMFQDGYRNRYYFRRGVRADLDWVMMSIDRDDFLHRWGIGFSNPSLPSTDD